MKLAASTLVLGVTTMGCKAASDNRVTNVSARAPRSEADAVKLYASAQQAMQQGQLAVALSHTERAVELAPRDVGYRMLLGDLYLKSGRFRAAETSFADVLTLDPGNQRASLSVALAQIALGKTAQATVQLEQLALTAAPADVGLAFALAGQPQRAVEMIEPAARAADANGRVRQNLALAYALAGDWQKARVTAAQDVSPADLNGRLQQWAAFAQPKASWDQVASLLGVTPAEDPGQPVRLALAPPTPAQGQFAAAVAVKPIEAAPAEPATIAFAAAAEPDQPIESVPQPVPTEETRFAEAAQSLVSAPVIRASAPAVVATTQVAAFEPGEKPRIAGPSERAFEAKVARRRQGRFVVQIGAFASPEGVERAWAQASQRYPFTDEREPLSTTVTLPGKGTFHRLSVSGFGTHLEASRLCGAIRSKGGACFVRTTAGDSPVQWASRYSRRG
ncbi:MAG TPA: SPOR domain-containing protein [Allosphingosinicella sp.]|nr:SPOR domain-containing protein [Allosphingosinicella sp.]